MKYQYTVFLPSNPNEQWKRRPMLQIEIFGKKGSQKFNALIDSGADYSLFNIQVAELLGLDMSKAKVVPFLGISGPQAVFVRTLDGVEIQVNGLDKKVKIPVGFIDSESVSLLLGQEGFFDQFRIKFEKDHNIFEVTSVKK